MDFVVSQSNALYFQELLEYRKILKHRSKILSDARVSRSDVEETLAPWDEQLIIHGSAITLKRQAFVNEFQDFISSAYHQLVGSGEEPGMAYEPSVELGAGETEADHREKFRAELRAHRTEEVRLGSTLYGPHRDELALRINGLDLRKYASQGQHKTFLVALKIGEFFYLRDRCSEPPILLLDDIFSELDGQRADQLLRFTGELSQTFITSTNAHLFDAVSTSRGEPKRFTIHEGAVIEDHAAVTR